MKRALSILLVIATLLVCAPAVPLLHAHAEETWDGTPATAFASGDGTAANPYMIETVGQLVYLAISVNQGNSYEDQYIALANDIEFSAADFEVGGSLYNDGRGWTPIGYDIDIPFAGHFDGNGHAIRNLEIGADYYGNINMGTDPHILAGLFGNCVGSIRNLRMENCSLLIAVEPEEVSSVTIHAGMVVGMINCGGLITGCTNDGSVTVYISDALDSFTSITARVGGIVGEIFHRDEALTNTYGSNSGAVTVNLTLYQSNNVHIYAGGIVGMNGTCLTECVNSGAVTIRSNRESSYGQRQFYYAGGIAGSCEPYSDTDSGKAQNCTNQGAVTVEATDTSVGVEKQQENFLYAYAGGIAGLANNAKVLGCRNDASIVSKVKEDNAYTKYYPNAWAVAGGIAGNYKASTIDHAINSASVYSELAFVSENMESLQAVAWAGGIAGCSDTDGSGTISQSMNYGKVSVNSYDCTSSAAGGIAGNSTGTITECANRGGIFAESYGLQVLSGGIAGDACGTIKQCANLGTINAFNWNEDADRTGNFAAYAGGIAGYHSYYASTPLTVENCYNAEGVAAAAFYASKEGAVCSGGIMGNKQTGDTVNYCYNIGNIYAEPTPNSNTGYAFAGGIVGMYGDEGAANYYLDNFSVSHGYGNYKGNQCTDAQMQLQETFVGFDFLDVWTMQSDLAYPYPELYALENMFSSEAVELALVSLPAKTTYTAGECIDYSGLKVQGTYLNGEKVDLTNYTCSISKDTPLAAGTHTVEVRFNGARVTFPITVSPKAFNYIDVTDLDVPVRSAMPDTEVTVDPLFHSVSSVDWSTDGPFAFGKEYAVTLTLKPTESASYSADTKVRINGTVVPSRYDAGTNTITATCQFPSVTGVFFHIIDAETGEPVSDATVTLGKHVVTTGTTGKAFFEVSLGSVTNLSVTAELYPDYVVDNYVIGEDPNVYIMLSEIKDGIQTAFCNGTDVLLNSTQINTYASHLQAQIQVSGRSARKITRYEIVQKNLLKRSVVIASSTNGNFNIPNTSFKKNADVYVRMYTVGSDGEHVYECKLKIKTLSFHLEKSIDFDDLFPVSMDYGFGFPAGTPLLEGHEVMLPSVFGKDYRTVVQIGNDKILIGAGQIQDLLDKDQTKKDKDDIFKEMLDEWKKQETYDKESEVTGMIALVIEFDENSVTRAYGHFYVKYQLEIETGATIIIPVIHIPIRVDIEVGFGGRVIMTNLGYDFEKMEWLVPKYQVGFNGSVEARLGIGCKVVSAGVYGSAELDVLFDVTPQWELASLELSGELGLHATYNGLIVDRSLKYPLVSEEFTWPVNTYALRRTIYTPESYGPLDRSYLADRSEWLGQIAKLSEGSTVSALQLSAYEGIEPKMAVCGDTVMMVFMDDDGSEGLNYQHLYYSLYDRASRTWSEPAKVDDNGLTDLQFEVISDGSHIHIIYTEAGLITEENKDDLPGLAAAVEVATAVYDPTADRFTDYTVLTDNDSFETMPQLAATDDGLVAVWTTNLANDVFGQNANNLIHRSVYSGGSWSAPEACGPMGATIASLDAGRLDGEVYIAAIRDTDCDLATVHDRVISLTAPDGTVTHVQAGTSENDNATFLTMDGTDLLVWYADSNLHTIATPDAAPEALLDQAVSTLSPDFQFITLGTGSAILYTCTTVTTDNDGNRVTGSDVFGLFYRDGQWGEPVAVTHTQADRYVDAFAVFADGEDLVVPYRSTAATFLNGEMELACDFMTTNVRFAHNIGIDAMTFPPSQLFQGDALDVTVRVANHSWKDVDTVTVAVTDDKGNVVFTQAVACHIGSGGTENIAFTLDKDLLQQGIGYTVSLSPTGYADADPADNTTALALWYSDLTVQAKQLLLPGGSYLQYTVSNLGNLPSSGALQVYCMDGDTQTQLTSVPLDTLEPGASISGLLPVQDGYYAAGSVFLSVLPDTDELYDFNDTVTVPVRELTFSGSDIVDENDTATLGPALAQGHLDYDLYTGSELTVTAEENGFTFTGIEGLDAGCYTYADETLTLHESYLQTLAVGYHHLNLCFTAGEHTEDVLLTVEVTDSTPMPVTVTAQQAGTVYYDGHPVEPGVDFTYTTASAGNVSYSYSADGASWQTGLPTAAGTYTVLITVAPDAQHHYAGTQCTFALTIEKAARAISSPLALAVRDGQQTFGNAAPTAGSTQGQVLYGYSATNDASAVTAWSAEGILPVETNCKIYYIFAKVTEGEDYQAAVSLGLPLEAHVHSYTEVTQAPGCSTTGTTEFVCTCGDRYNGEETPAPGHDYQAVVTAPTCTEQGYTTHTCTKCGHSYVDSYVPATDHDFTAQWLSNSEGHYHKCGTCGTPSQQVSHSFSSVCDTLCDTCGYIRAVAHVPGGTWVTDGDRHWQKCSLCGAKANAADHQYDDSCDSYCNVCDHSRVVYHDYLPGWLLDETYHWRECQLCQHKAMYVKHDYDNNCDTDCNTCGHTRTTFHYYTNGISKDDNQHWRTCLYCHERILVEDHRYDNACDAFCDDCNYVRAISHAYASTWTSDGTNHWHECVICQHKQELLGHSYDHSCDTNCNDCGYVRTVSHYYLVVWSADEAEHWHECHVCGDRTDVTEHSWKAATCYEPKTCTVCGTSVGAAKGHNWKEATCTTPKTCTACGETEGTENWHSWKDGTCTEPMICTVCGEIGITAPGHKWTAATCWVPKTCAACGITEGEPLTHSWTTATCTESSKCALCGLFGSDALNHDWQDETCTQPMICKRCGETAGRPLGHNMLPADCTTPSTCGRCGHQIGSPKPHNWSAPTCTEPETCTNCGVTTGSPLPHSWAAATCWVPKTCTQCGLQEGDPKAHSWKPATCTEPETCTNCGTTRENPTGHLWQPATCYKPNICLNCGLTEGRPKGHDWTAATCTKPQTCVDCGNTTGKPVPHIYSDGLDGTCNVCGIHRETTEKRNVMHMFRMYDPNSGEHFYTGSEVERANLVAAGWHYEGVGFTFSQTTGLPVYRLYDPVYGEHLYTMDEAEKAALMAAGWNLEGIAFNSAYDTEVPQYRLHNPNAKRGAYHFTASIEERDFLISLGWEYQGIGFYSSWK